jgi:hypothetical protein
MHSDVGLAHENILVYNMIIYVAVQLGVAGYAGVGSNCVALVIWPQPAEWPLRTACPP